MRKTVAVVGLMVGLLSLAGCQSVGTGLQAVTSFHVTQKDVDSATAAYGTAQAISLAYLRLPRCASPAVQPCARHSTVAAIKADDRAIYKALHDTHCRPGSGRIRR